MRVGSFFLSFLALVGAGSAEVLFLRLLSPELEARELVSLLRLELPTVLERRELKMSERTDLVCLRSVMWGEEMGP